ncbi:MAG: hypothetical protein IKB01_04165 [Lachnospiraceae bacterium]|nr:hypothetical protein [Lachnospiraceae bacterium]
MTFDEFIDRADRDYNQLVQDLLLSKPLSVSEIEKASGNSAYNTVYLQDFLRFRTLTMISVYHDYLREQLLKTMNVDIGDFLGLDQVLEQMHDK